MMEVLKLIWLSFFTSLLGSVVGFGFTARRVVVAWYHLALIGLATFVFFILFFFIGTSLGSVLPVRVLDVIMGLGMIAIGILVSLSPPRYPGSRDFLFLVGALQLDVLLLSYHFAQEMEKSLGFALTTSLLLVASIVGGMMLGERRWGNWRLRIMLPYLPCVLLIFFGMVKVL